MKGTLLKNFGGRDRYLRYDANAWADIGDKLGIRVRMGHFEEDLMATPVPLSAFRTLIWGGLLHEEPGLAERDVGSWIDEENMVEVYQAFFSRFDGTLSPGAQEQLRQMVMAEGDGEVAVAPTT